MTTRQVRCECGYTAQGATDEEVIARTLAHVAADHPDLAAAVPTRGLVEASAATLPSAGFAETNRQR
ncbi:DUF1059 domain-containing protein [Kribbella sp. NBC_00889]|uniref:DUF1059 domain-containing protein n=1 Tax=Kribbella sp. NBC_00889 TaxID=2975974 RepID=UPI003870E990|nr:DUF1059 domain-containing protein [Kribbella sp. NBC_00889]